ncbi:MAG: hypothetical protein EOO77_30480 [Oxalobacteraceae bacterium]|nr:MAG: hypothetical protein EOO77_30480 [Oxalobacteraceae bacterium]
MRSNAGKRPRPRAAPPGAKAPGGLERAGDAGSPEGTKRECARSEWASRSRKAGSPNLMLIVDR